MIILIPECLFSARQRNNAAFELVNLSVTDDNNKFRIVQEGGCVCMPVNQSLNIVCHMYSLQVIQTLLTSEVNDVSYY